MIAASQESDTIVHVLFHGIGTPGPGVTAAEEPYFVGRDLLLAVLDDLREQPAPEVSSDVSLNVSWEVSFDDGFESDLSVALPALLERGMRARFFPLAGYLGPPGRLDSGGIRELAGAGMGIGSHGLRHRSWRGLDAAARREELVEARQLLSAAAGIVVDTAACPFGDYDRGALAALRGQGYRAVYTSDRRRARRGAWLQPRYSVRRGDTLQTVREQILAAPPASRRARSAVTARLKAWR